MSRTGDRASQMPIYMGHHLLEHCATSQAALLDAGRYKDEAAFSTTLTQQYGSWEGFATCPTQRATSLHNPQASVLLKSPSQMARSPRTTWMRGRWMSSPPPLKLVARPTGTRWPVTTHTAFHGLSLTLCLPSLVHAGQCTGSPRKAKGSPPVSTPCLVLDASKGLEGKRGARMYQYARPPRASGGQDARANATRLKKKKHLRSSIALIARPSSSPWTCALRPILFSCTLSVHCRRLHIPFADSQPSTVCLSIGADLSRLVSHTTVLRLPRTGSYLAQWFRRDEMTRPLLLA